MTNDKAHERLLALLTPNPDKPWCSTLDCPGCERRHMDKELEQYATQFGAATLDQQLTAIYLELARTDQDGESLPHIQGFRQLVGHAAELLPRSILAKVQLKFLLQQIQRGKIDQVAAAVLSVDPCCPDLPAEVQCELRNPNEITEQTLRQLREYADQLVAENDEVQS
jgi:hypothetical protein